MSDRIIDFNDLKNKVSDKDVDKFEQYVYSLYYSMGEGKIGMAEFSKKVMEYMEENNICNEKFYNIQKEFMKRYGFNMDNIQEEMKNLGIDIPEIDKKKGYETVRKAIGFNEKYKSRLTNNMVSTYYIKNDINEVEIILNIEKVILKSEKSIDLTDVELNEFLCSYKKVIEDKPLNISICENIKNYKY